MTSQNSTHTPGPWKVDDRGRITVPLEYAIGKSDKRRILTSPITGNHWQANAKLLAAAPDMLKALEQVNRWLEQALAFDAFAQGAAKKRAEQAYKQAEAAIEAATC